MSQTLAMARYREKAERALQSVRLLIDAGGIDGACNRVYYALDVKNSE